MRRLTLSIAVVLSMVVAVAAWGQLRGNGRVQGIVTDKATGKPIVGAKVTVSISSGNTQPLTTKTDGRGHWSVLGLTSGQWNIDIVADGYQTTRGSVAVSELQQIPAIQTGMVAEVKQEAQPETVAPTPVVPKEAADAIIEGQNLLKARVGDTVTSTSTDAAAAGSSTAVAHQVTEADVKENARRAVADFEKALPMVPTDKPEGKQIHDQLQQVMAQAYYRAGDVPKAISTLEAISTSDPSNVGAAALLANLYLQNGDLEKGKAALEKLPPDAIKDSTVYLNVGILFLNKKSPADAVTYFTKAINMEPKSGDGYYYRGLAYAQLKKTADARTDFQQVLALAPDSPEAKDAKAMLAALPAK